MMRLTGLAVAAMLLTACGPPDIDSEQADDGLKARYDKVFDLPHLMRDLDNGLRVVVVPVDYPDIFTIQIPVQAGARNEIEPGKTGFAHFFEHMMFRGTNKFPAEAYSAIMKSAGANENASTWFDYTNYFVTATTADLERIIELQADRFQHLAYGEEAFRTEALAVKGEYLKNYSDPVRKMHERLYDLGFDTHTYEHLPMGFLEDIDEMPGQFDYSRTFFERWYRPEKATVIVVGELDPEATFELVRKYFGGWQSGDYSVELPAEPPLAGPVYEHIHWDAPTQPWIMLGFRGPAFRNGDKAMAAAHMVSAIYFSESSDLYRKIVIEEQWADELVAEFSNQVDPGLLDIYLRLTDPAHAAAVIDAINETLARARTELVDDRTLGETRSRMRYSFTSRLDSADSIGSMLAEYVHFDRNPETVNALFASYEALTAKDIRHHAGEFFTDSGRIIVTLSAEPLLAGVDGRASIDRLVTARGMREADAAAAPPAIAPALPESAAADEVVPVQFVALPSPTSPLVDVTFLVHAGAGMDPEGKKGLANLTARMLADGGSQLLAIEEINAAMYPMAAQFEAQVDKEMTRLTGQVHRDNLDRWYALISGQLLLPAWAETDFQRIRNQQKNAILTDLVGKNDEELGKEVLYSTIYGDAHPYGSFNRGAVADLDAITLVDVRDFYRRFYTVRNITVGLSGGYPESFPARISNDLQRLPPGDRVTLDLPAAPMPQGHEAVIVDKQTPAVAVSLGFPIELRRGDPDWVALWLVRSYLGEHRSTIGQLYQRIRELRGMNYGDYAYIEYFPDGMFNMLPGTNLGRQQQIFQVWIRPARNNNDAHFATRIAMYELGKLIDEGLSESDFEAARAYLSKSVSVLTDGQARRLGYALDSQYYGIDEFPDYVRRALDKLTLEDVNRVIRENLSTEAVQYVFVTSDADDLRERLVDDRASPMEYNAEMPQAVLDEDERIETLPLGFSPDKVRVVSADDLFR